MLFILTLPLVEDLDPFNNNGITCQHRRHFVMRLADGEIVCVGATHAMSHHAYPYLFPEIPWRNHLKLENTDKPRTPRHIATVVI